MPSSRLIRISRWGLGIAYIIGLTACGAAAPGSSPAPPGASVSAEAPAGRSAVATIAVAPTFAPTTIPAVIATQLPAATPKETAMPDQKPTHPPARPTLRVAETLAPEAATTAATPAGAPPGPTLVAAAPVELAKADLARRRAVALDTIRVVEVRSVTWPNPGLGCPQPGMAYKQVPVDGLLIRLESGGQVFEYHSGGSKAPFLCENPAGDNATPVSGGEST